MQHRNRKSIVIAKRRNPLSVLLALVSIVAIAAAALACVTSGDGVSGVLSTLHVYAEGALYTRLWAMRAIHITSRDLTVLIVAVPVLALATWLMVKVFFLGKRAAGG
jgi:hypothetical protein